MKEKIYYLVYQHTNGKWIRKIYHRIEDVNEAISSPFVEKLFEITRDTWNKNQVEKEDIVKVWK